MRVKTILLGLCICLQHQITDCVTLKASRPFYTLPPDMMLERPLFAEEPSPQEEEQATRDVFIESSGPTNLQRLERIEKFIIKKLRSFLGDTSIEVDRAFFKDEPCINITPLDQNHCLVTITLEWLSYCATGYVFVIARTHPNWDPINLDKQTCCETSCDIDQYRVVTHGTVTPLYYEKPLLSYYLRGCANYAAIGERRSYLFKNAEFSLIRIHETKLDEEKSKDVDFNDENISYDDYLIDTYQCMDPYLSRLYNKFAPKDAPGLEQEKAWVHIGFVCAFKTFFHERPNAPTQQTDFAVQGDILYLQSRRKNWIYAKKLSSSGTMISGWILAKDVQTLALEENDF